MNWIALLVLSASVVDCYKYPDKILKFFGVDSGIVLAVFLFFVLVMGLKDFHFSESLKKINWFLIMPVSVVLAVGAAVLNDRMSVNYVYSEYGLNIHRLGYLALGSVALSLVTLGKQWWKSNYKSTIFLGSILGFGILWVVSLWPFDQFLTIVLEDGLIEYLQFGVVLVAGLLAMVTSKKLVKKTKFWSICFLLFSMALLFVAFDEISWGQRIFGLVTPDGLADANLQQEITAHNLKVVTPFIWWAYAAVGVIGSLGWMLKGTFFKVPWYATSYFGGLLIYSLLTTPGRVHRIGEWSEVAELAMYVGILIYCVYAYRVSLQKMLISGDE